jgi:hypothetical protein
VRAACYHARYGKAPAPRYGERVQVAVIAKRGTHPRNVLVVFEDGTKMVTSVGCLRWKCERHHG